MIPKIIHYCWLSGDPYPKKIKKCIESWKRLMPDYEFICWDMNRFDVKSVRFVDEACQKRKWAFAADYIRLYALYNYGGIYLDSDVMTFKRLDDFLDNKAFSSIESYFYKEGDVDDFKIDAAMIASEKGNPFIADCLEYYKNRRFIKEDGSLDESIICHIIAGIAEQKYNFKRGVFSKDVIHLKDNVMSLYPPYVFTHLRGQFNRKTVAMHLYVGSWRDSENIKYKIVYKIDDIMLWLIGEKYWSFVRSYIRNWYLKFKYRFLKG